MTETQGTGDKYRTTLEALEARGHVPLSQTQEERPEAKELASTWAWDGERRQVRLAGGA